MMQDRQLMAVKRPFDAAFLRMCQAADPDLLDDELSNMLQQMYRLGELRKRRWKRAASPSAPGTGKLTETELNAKVKAVPGVMGALWIRAFDTHDVVQVSTLKDAYTDFYTEMYGVLVWKPVASMPFVIEPTKNPHLDRYEDYKASLQNRPVLDTMRQAFDGLAMLP